MKKVNVALAQYSPVLRNKENNLESMKKAVESGESDLCVFGELFLTGYMCKDDLHRLAEPLNGKSVTAVSKMAKRNGTTIVFGMPERDEHTKVVYNTCVVATPDENIQRYRKIYLANFGPFEEAHYFRPGHELEVIKTSAGKLGCLVCFDIFFPEIAKTYALKGAEILTCISASPTHTREFFERVMVARAIENTSFFLYSNLVGTEVDLVFWGGNTVVGPRGDIKAKGEYLKEGIVRAELDLEEIKITRKFRPTIRDTRTDILGLLRDSRAR